MCTIYCDIVYAARVTLTPAAQSATRRVIASLCATVTTTHTPNFTITSLPTIASFFLALRHPREGHKRKQTSSLTLPLLVIPLVLEVARSVMIEEAMSGVRHKRPAIIQTNKQKILISE